MTSKTISTVSDGYSIDNLSIAVVVNRERLMASLGKDATPEQVDKQIEGNRAARRVGCGTSTPSAATA